MQFSIVERVGHEGGKGSFAVDFTRELQVCALSSSVRTSRRSAKCCIIQVVNYFWKVWTFDPVAKILNVFFDSRLLAT